MVLHTIYCGFESFLQLECYGNLADIVSNLARCFSRVAGAIGWGSRPLYLTAVMLELWLVILDFFIVTDSH